MDRRIFKPSRSVVPANVSIKGILQLDELQEKTDRRGREKFAGRGGESFVTMSDLQRGCCSPSPRLLIGLTSCYAPTVPVPGIIIELVGLEEQQASSTSAACNESWRKDKRGGFCRKEKWGRNSRCGDKEDRTTPRPKLSNIHTKQPKKST